MWDYLFYDNETGEEFFVECNTEEEAIEIANKNFNSPKLNAIMTPKEAEWFGYDTY